LWGSFIWNQINQKQEKLFMTYMMVMQLIVTIIAMAFFGHFIGTKINPDSDMPIIMTAVGLSVGVMISFITLLQFIKSEERYERRTRH
jgi:uncharacterized membrane protein (DUF485 family)